MHEQDQRQTSSLSMSLLHFCNLVVLSLVSFSVHSIKALSPSCSSIPLSKRTGINRGIHSSRSMSGVDEQAGYRIDKASGDWDSFSEQMHETMDKCLARVQKFRR